VQAKILNINKAGNITRVKYVATKIPIFLNQGHPIDDKERLRNKTNTKISNCQTTKQEFGRRMKGRLLAKGD